MKKLSSTYLLRIMVYEEVALYIYVCIYSYITVWFVQTSQLRDIAYFIVYSSCCTHTTNWFKFNL